MPQIGSVTNCTFVHGVATGLRQRVQSWFVPGVDGQFALTLGFNDGEFAFTVVLYDTKANVATWRAALEALLGTVVTIVDDWARSWTNCLITGVSALKQTPATGTSGGVEARGEITITGRVVA